MHHREEQIRIDALVKEMYWKSVTISEAKKGDFNGSKYIDLFFEGYPETMKCRLWEARNKYGQEFSVANMFRYSNPTVLAEMNMGDGKTAASLDDSPLALKGKSLQVLFYKNDNGYTKISQKVAPATPFQNIMDNFTEDTIARIKQSAKKYQVKMMMVLRGEHTRAIKEYLEKIDEELNKDDK